MSASGSNEIELDADTLELTPAPTIEYEADDPNVPQMVEMLEELSRIQLCAGAWDMDLLVKHKYTSKLMIDAEEIMLDATSMYSEAKILGEPDRKVQHEALRGEV